MPIVKKGEKGDACYFVYDGEVEVVGRDLIGLETVLATLGIGRIFGEVTLYRENVPENVGPSKKRCILVENVSPIAGADWVWSAGFLQAARKLLASAAEDNVHAACIYFCASAGSHH